MSKRYVFWKRPDGRPYRGTDSQNAPIQILARIGNGATVEKTGEISWTDFNLIQWETAVNDSLVIIDDAGNELPSDLASTITDPAIRDVIKKDGGKKPIEPPKLLKAADRRAADYFRLLPRRFALVSSMSINCFPANSLSIGDCDIGPIKHEKFYPPPKALTDSWEIGETPALQRFYGQPVRVFVDARSPFEAASIGIDSLNLLRGYWMLITSYGSLTYSLSVSPKRKPVAEVRVGPYHTIHTTDGSPACENYWFEPNYHFADEPFQPRGGWKRVEFARKRLVRKLKAQKYAKEVERLITRYASALDTTDFDVGFLQIWSILEKLTNTVGANYDQTVARTTRLFKEEKTHAELLGVMRTRRNQYVHAARSGSGRSLIMYEAKLYVERHILELIHNKLDLSSIEEYAEYLCLPTDSAVLRKRKRWIDAVISTFKKSGK